MASSYTARLKRKGQKLAKMSESFELILKDNSWLLGDEVIEDIKPGDEQRIQSILNAPFENPLAAKTLDDVENPHKHILRLMRNPEYFPFTCKQLLNITILPFQHVILKELWYKPFPMLIGSRGMGKSFILALYMVLRALINQGIKIIIVGSAFRQAKVVFEYVEQIWANAPVLRDVCGNSKGRSNRDQGPRRDIDRCECIIGDSVIIALPLGDGKKIRGQRANIVIADEFASIPPDIYEVVVKGFGAVSQDPIGGVKDEAWKQVLRKLGRWDSVMDEATRVQGEGNQAILSGTASYSFNWFAKYWNYYKSVIYSRGNREKLQQMNPDREIDPSLDYRDYIIIRMSVDMLPKGFMDIKTIASSRSMSNKSIAMMEYGAVFVTDSDGYFKRSLIEACVAGNADNDFDFSFTASLRGEPGVKHMIGVDPASETDNFAIVVIAMHGNHRRVVHCWTTRKSDHRKRLKNGLTKEENFFAFAARKIRELMRLFPTERIIMDAQGGGNAIAEALHDKDKLEPGELPIWPVKDPDPKKRKDSDNKRGLHMLEMVEFSNAAWVNEANTGLKKDMEDKVLLFPYMDSALLGFSIEEDKQLKRRMDTLEDTTMEIEAMKDELASIVHSQTDSGRDKWDVPKIKASQGEVKGRLRKDRYSALLLANMAARQHVRGPKPQEYDVSGGWAGDIAKGQSLGGVDYVLGEGWGQMEESEFFGVAVTR